MILTRSSVTFKTSVLEIIKLFIKMIIIKAKEQTVNEEKDD
jgi:hypothetical protein